MRTTIITIIFIISGTTISKAQLPNSSFEFSDSLNKLSSWKINQGKLTKLSAVNFGAIPFTAFHGNYFALLQSDTLSTPIKNGIIQQSVAFVDTPKSISINNLYLPENTSQHAQFILLFTRWNGTSRDTVLYVTDTLPIIAQGNSIPIQWNVFNKTLTQYYRIATLPDSASLTIVNDDSQTGKTVRLYIDNIQFGKWPVGLKENTSLHFSLYPNPANNQVVIKANTEKPVAVRLITPSGQEKIVSYFEVQTGSYELHTADLAEGLYIIQLISHSAISQQLILIQH
jgi:hypothetical protein